MEEVVQVFSAARSRVSQIEDRTLAKLAREGGAKLLAHRAD